MKRQKLYAVWDSDLEAIISRIMGISDPKNSEYKCSECGRSINYQEIAAIRISSRMLEFYCCSAKCVEEQ